MGQPIAVPLGCQFWLSSMHIFSLICYQFQFDLLSILAQFDAYFHFAKSCSLISSNSGLAASFSAGVQCIFSVWSAINFGSVWCLFSFCWKLQLDFKFWVGCLFFQQGSMVIFSLITCHFWLSSMPIFGCWKVHRFQQILGWQPILAQFNMYFQLDKFSSVASNCGFGAAFSLVTCIFLFADKFGLVALNFGFGATFGSVEIYFLFTEFHCISIRVGSSIWLSSRGYFGSAVPSISVSGPHLELPRSTVCFNIQFAMIWIWQWNADWIGLAWECHFTNCLSTCHEQATCNHLPPCNHKKASNHSILSSVCSTSWFPECRLKLQQSNNTKAKVMKMAITSSGCTKWLKSW